MKNSRASWFHVLVFVLAQVAWLILLGLWIYWYVTNYMFITEVGQKFSPQVMSEGFNHLVLIGGLILLVAISIGMSLLFHRLSVQFNLTQLYDNFIANVTHELKSPLTAIQLYLETMKRHDLSREKQAEFIAQMLKDTNRLNNLISAILQIPALEQKKIAHDFQVWSMDTLIRDLVQEAKELFNLSPQSIQVSGKGGCACVVDRNALRIVLDNLIDNSMKYSQGRLGININLACERKRFVLLYSDQGIGIPQQEQRKVFHKFFRSQSATMPSVKGTGLGLYWAKEIIRYHRGSIRVHSRGQDMGTTFRIELPLYREQTKRSLKNLIPMRANRRAGENAEHGTR